MSKYRNSKSYYDVRGVSCQVVIYSCDMKFAAGNAFKYLFRNGYSNPKNPDDKREDMKKVLHYLEQARKNTDYPRINKSYKHINSINIEDWPERIHKAMVLILLATASRDANPYQMYTEAIEVVSEELLCC